MIAADLRRRRYWAWIAAIIVFGIYAPSLFMPLGIVGLLALLDRNTKAMFDQDRSRSAAPA